MARMLMAEDGGAGNRYKPPAKPAPAPAPATNPAAIQQSLQGTFSRAEFEDAYKKATGKQNNPFDYYPERLASSLGFKGPLTISTGKYVERMNQGQHDSGPFMETVPEVITNPEWTKFLDGYRFAPAMDGKNGAMDVYDASGRLVHEKFRTSDHTGSMMKFMSAAVPALVGAGFGVGLGPLLGGLGGAAAETAAVGNGAFLGEAAGAALPAAGSGSFFTMPTAASIGKSALINGAISKAQGGDFLKGALTGAVTGGLAGFTPAAGLGITDATLGGAVNGAARGAVSAAISGGDVGRGMLTAGVAGGIAGFNPAARMGVTNTSAGGLINGALTGMATGQDPKAAVIGALSRMSGSQLSGMLPSFGSSFDEKSYGDELVPGIFEPGGAGYEPVRDAPDPINGYDYDGSVQPTSNANTGASAMSGINGYDYDGEQFDFGGNFYPGDSQEEPALNADGSSYYGQGAVGTPMSRDDFRASEIRSGGGSQNPGLVDDLWSGFKSWIAGGGTGNITSGSGSIFSTANLAGIIGSGINAAFLSDQADKGRQFQKSQTEASWAREERMLAERRARMAPIRKQGLLSSAITTSRTGP